jgi:hypothetical protein
MGNLLGRSLPIDRHKLERLWQGIAFGAWNSFICVLCLNLLLALVFRVVDAYRYGQTNPLKEREEFDDRVSELYPEMSDGQVNNLINETWTRSLIDEPFTGFAERANRGEYVNVSPNGYRVGKDQGPWPPQKHQQLVIFLFGGSNTFSYGVPDDLALGSRLQDVLRTTLARPVAVYNFGRGYYYSTQERILFEQLLSAGYVPNMAIFLDGMNDFNQIDVSFKPARISGHGHEARSPVLPLEVIKSLAIGRFAQAIQTRLQRIIYTPTKAPIVFDDASLILNSEGKPADDSDLISVVERYFKNKAMIEGASAAFGVLPLFVWQPTPVYKYDLTYHLFSKWIEPRSAFSRDGYPIIRSAVDMRKPEKFIWCADIQNEIHEPLYVDSVHYSPKMIGMVATCIADGVKHTLSSANTKFGK